MINNVVEGRCLSALEVACRILSFQYLDRQPCVVRLDVHLNGYYSVYYGEGDERTIVAREKPGTKTTGWFKSNKIHPTAR